LLVPLVISFVLNLFQIGGGVGVDPDLTLTSFIAWMVFNFFSGPLAEEAGWRGYLLPRLQSKYNSLAASLLIGFVWTLWHVPLAFVVGADQAELGVFGWVIYTILVFTISVILTWLFNNTSGSLVIVILAHFFFNVGSNIVVNMFGLVNTMFYNIIGGIAGVCYLILIFVGFGYKRFSKLDESEIPVVSTS
jgi:membrane protease YdiL (CAAX protease family)